MGLLNDTQESQTRSGSSSLTSSDELIGVLCRSPHSAGRCLADITEESLDTIQSKLSYRTILQLLADGGTPTVQAIATRIAGSGTAEELRRAFRTRNGVKEYLYLCLRSVGEDSSIDTVVQSIKLEAKRRDVTDASQELAQIAMECTSTEDLIRRASVVVGDVVSRGDSSRAGVENIEGMTAWLERREEPDRAPKEWDWIFPSWMRCRKPRAGNIIVIAARSGIGKSWMGLQFLESVCRAGGRTAYFTMEMPEDSLRERIVLMGGHITRDDVDYKTFDFDKIRDRVDEISKWDYVTFTGRTDIKRIAAECTLAEVRGRPFDAIVIDHLHLVRMDKRHGVVNAIDDFCEALRSEIADRHMPLIVLLTQFRKMDKDEMPGVEDLKGSAAIEQIADRIIMVNKKHKDDIVGRAWNPKVRDGTRLPPINLTLHEKLNRWVESP